MEKKIFLYIDSMQYGGAQRVMSNIAEYLANADCSITLINDILPSTEEPEYEIDKRIKRYFLDEGNNGTQNKNIYRIKKLRKLIKIDRPDVILSFLGPPNIRMLAATLGLKCRKIVSVRNDPYREYGAGIKRLIARIAFLFANGCVFQTKDAASYFPIAVQRKSKIIVNPVNDKFYRVTWTGEKNEIAVVGRLQPQKNPLLALEAFHLIESQFPEFKIVFYGDEELKDAIHSKAVEYSIADRVIVFGKAADIENKLAASAVYLLSSDFEGMPNALLEAMAVGVPAIATDCPCGGPRTVIEDETQGILVPCGDASKMADALSRVIRNKSLSEKMSISEKQRAEKFRNDKIMLLWRQFLGA